MLAFLQSSFPPQVPVKLRVPVCRPFTLNTHIHVCKHPYQRRWRPGAPRADWRAAWGMESPAQMCSVLPQAESSVSLSTWQPKYIVPNTCVTPPTGSGSCHACRPRGLCTDEKLTHHRPLFCLLVFLGAWITWSLMTYAVSERDLKKAILMKGLSWAELRNKQVDIHW